MVYKDILVSVIFFFSFEANTTMDSLYHVLIIVKGVEGIQTIVCNQKIIYLAAKNDYVRLLKC